MEQEYMDRGYLLPPGCKDLIDVLNLKTRQPPSWSSAMMMNVAKPKPPGKLSPSKFDLFIEALKKSKLSLLKLEPKPPFLKQPPAQALPPIVGEIVVPAETTVLRLAALLGEKPFQIIADVAELGFFVFPKHRLSFEIISKVARKHGFFAIRAGS